MSKDTGRRAFACPPTWASFSRLFVVAIGLNAAAPLPARADGCSDASGVCLAPEKGASFASGESTSDKDKKKRADAKTGTMSVTVQGGRGSVFVNGRYVGTGSVSGVSVPVGRNDLEVRDGRTVLAKGVLTVPKGGSLQLTVVHP